MCCIQLKLCLFCNFWLILAKMWLPWQRPLDPCNQKCLLWIGRPRKPPVISNHILVIFRRNTFISIYSNFSPDIGCHGNAPLSRVYGSVIDEFPHSTNSIPNPNSALMCCIQLKLWPYGHFCDFLAYFRQNLVAMVTPLWSMSTGVSHMNSLIA